MKLLVVFRRFQCAIRRLQSHRRYCTRKFRYSDTINQPVFQQDLESFLHSKKRTNNVAQFEEHIQKMCGFTELYKWQRGESRKKEFVLHDGPPYANGDTHVGHAINKIVKDIINRYKLMRGYKIHYVPGWDCHGLPIELKAVDSDADKNLSALQIREKAKQFAENAIASQRESFQRWGVMADWDQCYCTFQKQYEASQLNVFYKMYEKGLIYTDYMPVYWSPSSKTSLAEAELEYNDQHVSSSVYVKFSITKLPKSILALLPQKDLHVNNINAVIWTTTPWTLQANEAIAYSDNIQYCIVLDSKTNNLYLVCDVFVTRFQEILDSTVQVLCKFQGTLLEGCKYINPLKPKAEMSFYHSSHVTTSKGTGLVHTAPAHGHDDYSLAIKHQLPIDCHVDENGCYTEMAGSSLAGKDVLLEGNYIVIKMLGEDVLHSEEFIHSYPYDWRTKKPVIIRASQQWFVNTSRIKERAKECLDEVPVTPASFSKGVSRELDTRTYWCISRQRVWGLPIPVCYHKDSGRPVISRDSVEHILSVISKHGSDCWWAMSVDELFPKHILKQSGFNPDDEFIKGEDILDIWFDSGVSWSSVLKDVNYEADLYLEGYDQFAGWFQSSLLTSVAINNKAPYRSLLIHGFTTDEKGKKMSKSIGNVVDPKDVIYGNKKKGFHSYGADVLRWWAASFYQYNSVGIGQDILYKRYTKMSTLCKLLRFLLGNLHDYDPGMVIAYNSLQPSDQFMLNKLYHYTQQVTDCYESYDFRGVLKHMESLERDVSAFYCHVTKDRLYCSVKDSPDRLAIQYVLYHTLKMMVQSFAPILPHLAEAVYHYSPISHQTPGHDSIFKTTWVDADSSWLNASVSETLETIFSIREQFFDCVGSAEAKEMDVVLYCTDHLYSLVKTLQEEETSSNSTLCELFQSARISVVHTPPPVLPEECQIVKGQCNVLNNVDDKRSECHYTLVILPAEGYKCERCHRYTAEHIHEPCERCMKVMSLQWS